MAGRGRQCCLNETLARYAREHNGANVLALGSTLLTTEQALAIVDVSRHADARSALHPPAGKDPRARDQGPKLNGSADVQRLVQIIVEELAATAQSAAAVQLPRPVCGVLPGPAARGHRAGRPALGCMRPAARLPGLPR